MSDVEQNVRLTLAALDAEERDLANTIKNLEVRLSRVRAAKSTLLALASDEPIEFEGKLADAMRTVLMAQQASYIPTQIRDKVKEIGYTFRDDQNQMAAVHGVLKRMIQSGEVETKEWTKQPGVTRYYWAAFTPKLAPKPTTKVAKTASVGLGHISGLGLAALYATKPKKEEK